MLLRELKKYDLSFLFNVKIPNPVAVTFTEKQIVDSIGIDNIRSSQNIRHFLNLLNKNLFKNASKRYGKRVSVISVMEFNETHRHHIHMKIERPDRVDFNSFEMIARDCWKKTNFGYQEMRFKDNADDGWLSYMLKSRTKTNLADNIDWENIHF